MKRFARVNIVSLSETEVDKNRHILLRQKNVGWSGRKGIISHVGAQVKSTRT